MNEQTQIQLNQTRNAFFKLQDNFNHNLLVIKQLEQENEKLLNQCQNLKMEYHQQIDQLHGVLNQLKNQNKNLNHLLKSEVQKVRSQCQEETQQIIEMMNQKMMEEKKYQAQKFAKQRKQTQGEAQKYEQSLKYYSLQNSKLIQTIKQLKNDKENMETQLAVAISQKQSYSNKFLLHQKQLQNMRNASEQWEKVLKDKIKQVNKEKQKLQEQLSETKMSYKLKLKTIRDEAAKKMQDLQINKQKMIRQLVQQSRQIKFQFDNLHQQLQKIKIENKNSQKQKSKMQNTINQLSKQATSQKQIEYLKKLHQQQKIQLKNQNKLIQNERNSLRQQLKDVNQRRQEVEKSVQRLKTGLISAQKEIAEGDKKVKKLQRQIKELKSESKRLAQTGANVNGGYHKFSNEDLINQNPTNAPQNMDFSKYFSQDQGPVDDMFFMQNSVPRQPRNIPKSPGPSTVNHQLMKKIGELQVQIDQYKNMIKVMSQQMQKEKQSFFDKLSFKDQQIKLSKSQIYMLREKINERQQQLLTLNTIRQQIQDKERKLMEKNQNAIDLQAKVHQKTYKISQLQKQLSNISQCCRGLQQKLKASEDQLKILEQINQQLRGQIHIYKNRVKLYNEEDQSQSQDSCYEVFQQIQQDKNNLANSQQFKRSTKIKRKQKSRSKSKSGPKKKQIASPLIQNNSSKVSMKLKDLVIKKKQLQMEGKKMQIEYKQPSSIKNIEKTGTNSQKQILDNMKRASQSKEKKRIQKLQRLREIDYDRLLGRVQDHQEDQVL